ncbi:TasA family protein [Methanosarcina sp. WH1]|uniref:TasA family protein n=1 Tax=Methanosarcina sp. WH1 TaxID=1434102 RepID=UPI0006154B22|nr:TasA family protein [Methanosarcina sp. WH1]AKB21134.1 hypothetical protein MSWH1_0863 [Methanosarcina sp. WH1]
MINKKILLSVLTIGVLAVVAGAGTWAAFSDTETSENNTFTAGTLDLKVGGVDDPDVPFVVEDVFPGATGSADIVLSNAGTMPGALSVKIVNIIGEGGDFPEPESVVDPSNAYNLDDVLTVSISDGTNTVSGKLSELTTAQSLGVLDVGTGKTFTVTYSVDSSAGNEIQGDKVTFDVEVSLNQQ